MHSRVRLASIPIAVPTVLFHWPSLAPGLRQGTCRWSCALDRRPVALGQSALPSTGARGSDREGEKKKKKKRTAIYLALWPGPAAVSLLSIAPFSSRRPLSGASSPTSVPSRRPPSSPFVPSAACWLGATSCHPSPVEAQTLQQSTNLLLPAAASLFRHGASSTVGRALRASLQELSPERKRARYLVPVRADVRFGVELGVQRRAWVWTRVRGVCQRGVGGSA